MNNKHRKTLNAIFTTPISPAIPWEDIERLFVACGGVISEGRGSRVRVKLNGFFATFHRPHPAPFTNRGAVKSVRNFLEKAGIQP